MSFQLGNQLWKLRKTHKHTDKTKKKISDTLKKSGHKPPSPLGKKLSEKTKQKMRESAINSTNKGRFKKGHIPWIIGLTKDTNEIVKRMAENRMGEKNPMWNGGFPYPPEFFKIRKQILKRDLFTCQECHRHQNELEKTLEVHHIDYDKQNNNPTNLISLCNGCHNKTLHKKDDWINYYQNKINENLGVF